MIMKEVNLIQELFGILAEMSSIRYFLSMEGNRTPSLFVDGLANRKGFQKRGFIRFQCLVKRSILLLHINRQTADGIFSLCIGSLDTNHVNTGIFEGMFCYAIVIFCKFMKVAIGLHGNWTCSFGRNPRFLGCPWFESCVL